METPRLLYAQEHRAEGIALTALAVKLFMQKKTAEEISEMVNIDVEIVTGILQEVGLTKPPR